MRAARSGLRRDDGLSIVEVLVASLILVVVALGVGAAFVSAGSRTAANQARAAALGVAQQVQQGLRARSLTALAGTSVTDTVSVGGGSYTATTDLAWVADGAGVDACSETQGISRRISMVTTVTSTVVGGSGSIRTDPVVVRSTVAPSSAGLTGQATTLLARVAARTTTDYRADVPVTFTPRSGGSAVTVRTNDAGCAVAAGVSPGAYDVTASDTGWVSDTGDDVARADVTAAAGESKSAGTLRYARAGSIRVTFAGVGTSTGAGIAANSTAENGAVRSVASSTRQSALVIDGVFPFASAQSVRPEVCGTATGAATTVTVAEGTPTPITLTQGRARLINAGSSPANAVWPSGRTVVLRAKDRTCAARLVLRTIADGVLINGTTGTDYALPFGSWVLCPQWTTSGTAQYAQPIDVSVNATGQATFTARQPTSGTNAATTDAGCAA